MAKRVKSAPKKAVQKKTVQKAAPAQKMTKKDMAAWSFTGAFALIGLGLGFLFGNIPAGVLLGAGIGLLVTILVRYRMMNSQA